MVNGWQNLQPKRKTWEPKRKTWSLGGRACSDLITIFRPSPPKFTLRQYFSTNPPKAELVNVMKHHREMVGGVITKSFVQMKSLGVMTRVLMGSSWYKSDDWDDTLSHYLPWFATWQLPTLLHWQLIVLRFIPAGNISWQIACGQHLACLLIQVLQYWFEASLTTFALQKTSSALSLLDISRLKLNEPKPPHRQENRFAILAQYFYWP